MAHLIKLNQLDLNHDNTRTYVPILFNLDRAISMEPSVSGKHTAIITALYVQPRTQKIESVAKKHFQFFGFGGNCSEIAVSIKPRD